MTQVAPGRSRPKASSLEALRGLCRKLEAGTRLDPRGGPRICGQDTGGVVGQGVCTHIYIYVYMICACVHTHMHMYIGMYAYT